MVVVVAVDKVPETTVQTVVRNRAAVPAFPKYKALPPLGTVKLPCPPATTTVSPPSSQLNSAPWYELKNATNRVSHLELG